VERKRKITCLFGNSIHEKYKSLILQGPLRNAGETNNSFFGKIVANLQPIKAIRRPLWE
jgi:hypothetical protein